MSNEKWHDLTTVAQLLEAHALKGDLESEGIEVRLLGEALLGAVGELPVDAQQIRVQVPEQELARARQLLEQRSQQHRREWRCPHCGELNGSAYEVCWRCGCDPLASD